MYHDWGLQDNAHQDVLARIYHLSVITREH